MKSRKVGVHPLRVAVFLPPLDRFQLPALPGKCQARLFDTLAHFGQAHTRTNQRLAHLGERRRCVAMTCACVDEIA